MLKTDYQKFIHLSRYARWRNDLKRRETWAETVDRYVDYITLHLAEKCDFKLNKSDSDKIRANIYKLNVMPSMRCLMTAGEALKRDNAAAYNCAYLPIESIDCFSELMYLLMSGCGVGFSVEKQYVEKLPKLKSKYIPSHEYIIIEDDKLGWCNAFNKHLRALYNGGLIDFDYSKLRPAGTPF